MGSGIICKQYQPWYRGLLLFFLSFAELPAPAIVPPHCFLLNLMHVFPCCPYATSLPPCCSSAMFGTRSPVPNCVRWPDPYEFSHFMVVGFFCPVPRKHLHEVSVFSQKLGAWTKTDICHHVWYDDMLVHTRTCACVRKLSFQHREVQQVSVGFLLLSLACHCYSRGFPLWAAVLIADEVVLAKYLVTVLRGWKMWEWEEAKGAPLLFYLI